MKKMLLLLAGLACLGMFVSCSDDPQEVAIVDSNLGNVEWAGKATASSVTYTGSLSTYYTYSASIDSGKYAELKYAEDTKGNMKSYCLTVPVIQTRKVTGSSTSEVTNTSVEIRIKKVGNDYYNREDGEKLTVTGSLEDKEFTIASIEAYNYTFTNLKFTRL